VLKLDAFALCSLSGHLALSENKRYLCDRMKSLTTVLAIAFTMLAIKPGLDMLVDVVSPMASCNIACSDDAPENSEGNACNPFQACGPCVLLCPKLISNAFQFMETPNDHGQGRLVSFISEYNADFWQPPKIV